MKRCEWAEKNELESVYHDEEWGVPVYDDRILFEFLVLESMQSGLSWITILKKREDMRMAFDNFDYNIISKYDDKKINKLLNNEGIIRHKLKINATINNANRFIEIQK